MLAAPGARQTAGVCAVCSGRGLTKHLAVRDEVGPSGLIPTTDQFGSALADIVRCMSCGHMQLERLPGEAELGEAYAEAASEEYVAEEAGQRATARRGLEIIERHAGPGALLDVGCWVGFLLSEAERRGWAGRGVEPSEFASTYARQQLGLDVQTADLFSAALPERSFDAVVLADVLEHLPRPAEALDRIAALLRPGGVLFLALPDAGSRVARVMGPRWWSVIPTHVHYFTRDSMRTLLRRRGFEPLYMRTDPKGFTVRYYLGRLRGYSEPLAAALVRAAEASGVADRIWAPDLRDRMAVVARSTSTIRAVAE